MSTTQTETTPGAAEKRTGALWWVTTIVSWVALLFVVAILLAAIVIPKLGGAQPYTILTGSMRPTYPPGTLVVVREGDTETLPTGTVVTYQIRSGEPDVVTHRIIATSTDKDGKRLYLTQGDNNPQPDDPLVKPAQIRGTLWYSIPYLGYVNNWLTGTNRTVVVGIAAGALFLYAAWQFVGAAVKPKAESKRRKARHRT